METPTTTSSEVEDEITAMEIEKARRLLLRIRAMYRVSPEEYLP